MSYEPRPANPYRSPQTETPPMELPATRARSRPVGVTILAVLHFFVGAAMAVFGGMIFSQVVPPEAIERQFGVPPAVMISGLVFTGALALGSAVGMLSGARWGWWLATVYYGHSLCGDTLALVRIMSDPEEMSVVAQQPGEFFGRVAFRLVIHSLLIAYFFRTNVYQYFGLTSLKRSLALAILLGISLAIAAIWFPLLDTAT